MSSKGLEEKTTKRILMKVQKAVEVYGYESTEVKKLLVEAPTPVRDTYFMDLSAYYETHNMLDDAEAAYMRVSSSYNFYSSLQYRDKSLHEISETVFSRSIFD